MSQKLRNKPSEIVNTATITRFLTWLFFITLSNWGIQTATAEQKISIDGYDIHYSVFNTSFLSPDIAKHYNIVRAKDRALINIAIRQINTDGSSNAKSANISGVIKGLVHSHPMEFKEVREQHSIYYIAQQRFIDQETYRYIIQVQADPNKPAVPITFTKKLYRDSE